MILVTGGTGFVGSTLARSLAGAKTQVRVVSRYVANPAARAANRPRTPGGKAAAPAPPPGSPAALTNTVAGHEPSGKRSDDVLFRLADRAFDFFIGLREVAAVILS